MKKIKLNLLAIGYWLLANVKIAFAQGVIPNCDPTALLRGASNPCTICDLLKLFNNVIQYAIIIGTSLAGLYFAYGAFVIMTSGGSEQRLGTGKSALWAAAIGTAIMLGAWVIIGTALHLLTGSPSALPWDAIQCL
ncbi:MAG: hypothetical protein A3I89_02835 [Candidatus Harrisonbacteria bacterium RIFCSPLOWO2_02_FULL_41_11]|uniref:Uncharacterized protein n=1 Tax=Candidatus Harrisonbacteria bacterium RIFCSPHIGHO2_02_FULL_42_16 TaxID=1798404 RepID=A0A1G1ZIJ5_9BACT|nr:MAG: hypothetical protein A3B92_03290 [Candidatus Harrisonbacteria bacterium RIFCSPHIGHO2_02_FULL_42_16]OGY67322.1 MAG: hypothetical protein A3I89_02835 [Candidatus Harrisonbacteria bacterium RIFCSPLOWO2_02_FULL_41_11]